MRVRRHRRRCSCLTSWLRPSHDRAALRADSERGVSLLPPRDPLDLSGSRNSGSRNLGVAKGTLPGSTSDLLLEAGDFEHEQREETELFTKVLRYLEYSEEAQLTGRRRSDSDASVHMSSTNSSTLGSCHRASHDRFQSMNSLRARSVAAEGPLSKNELMEVLHRLRYRELPSFVVASRLVEQVVGHYEEYGETLVRLPRPRRRLTVVGDIHGHINDLLHVLDSFGEPSDVNQYLFNGDFVDRGDWGPEVIFTLFCLKMIHPDAVHLNRGNHEDVYCNEFYGFISQLKHAYPEKADSSFQQQGECLYEYIAEVFDLLPLVHVIADDVFVVHGGLPLQDVTLDQIAAVSRGPVPMISDAEEPTLEDDIFLCMLWSDPSDHAGPNYHRGAGANFDAFITKRFLKRNGLRRIIRSHECVNQGVQETHDGLVWTVFSASNYNRVKGGNVARVVLIDSDLNLSKGDAWSENYTKGRESWGAGSFCPEAIDRLQTSAKSVVPIEYTVRERALAELRRMVFLARPQLLAGFEQVDAEKVGRITLLRWADVMKSCLRTSRHFPWLALGPYLYDLADNGEVPYIDFLLRYQNPLSKWLADRWCTAILNEISFRHGDIGDDNVIMGLFKRLDGSMSDVLSYKDLGLIVHKHLPATEGEARQQAVRIMALCRRLDTDRSGFVTCRGFQQSLWAAGEQNSKCPQGHMLQQSPRRCWQRFGQVCQCDVCGRHMDHNEARRHCAICDYDLCEICLGSNFRILQMEWDAIQSGVELLCRSHLDTRTLFGIADTDHDGLLGRDEFVDCLTDYLEISSQVAEALWHLSFQQVGESLQASTGKMRVEDFERCLSVVDAQTSCPQSP